MESISWKPEYSVSFDSIDNDHKIIIDLIGKALTFAERDSQEYELKEALNELQKYVIYHFGREENYFRLTSYTDEELHVQEHRNYLGKLRRIIEQISLGEKVALETFHTLSSCFLEHIDRFDKKYWEHFIKHGIS